MWRIGPGKLGALLAAAIAGSLAARPQDSTVFRAGTQTVAVFATVIGADGRLVTDLARDDFEIYDDGRRQALTVFSNGIQPISIVAMLDTSGSMTGNIRLLREASVQLFTHLLPGDKARVGNFGDRITVSPTFTNDQDELIRWLWTEMRIGGPTPLWGAVNVGMTALSRLEGRRVVLVFTDGHDASGQRFVTLQEVTRRAQVEEFMVYGVGLWGRGGGGRGRGRGMSRGGTAPPDPGLRTLAEETGGGYIELRDFNNLGPAFARVAEELHHQYSLGFSAGRLDGKLHKLEVRLRRTDLTVRARKSYLARAAGAGKQD